MGSNQTTVTNVGLAGAVATIVVFVAGELGVDMTAEVGAAIATVAAALVGYFVPARDA